MGYIITADDFGLSHGTNKAIIAAIQKKAVTSTNVMVNMPYWKEAVMIKNTTENVSVGIHFNLTAGVPVSDPDIVRSLVDDNGEFYKYPVFKQRIREGKISLDEVKAELNSQILLFKSELGEPDYWNSHNHIHMLPRLFLTFVNIASDNCIFKMRNNFKVCVNRGEKYSLKKNSLIKMIYCYPLLKKMKFPQGIAYYSSSDSKWGKGHFFGEYIDDGKIIEIIVHISDALDSDYFRSIGEDRITENRLMSSEVFLEKLREQKLVSFHDV